jgi:hypothetical protein
MELLMKKYFAILCLALILVFSMMIAFHHHEDGKVHDDCQICMAIYCDSLAISEIPQIQQNTYVVFNHSVVLVTLVNPISLPDNIRAPPA